jgi:predicted acyltransferase
MDRPERLHCLDALRGFDMIWIVGGREIVDAWATATGSPALETLAGQLRHVEWNGFTAWDLVFPLFLFIAGVAMPFSTARRIERGDDRALLARHVIRRGLTLVALGILYNIRGDSLESHRFASVLGRIGLGYLGAGLIVLRWRVRGQIAWTLGILLGYWAALSWIPVPGHGVGDLTPGHTFTDWVDQQLLPGRLHRGDRDPEGLFSAVPSVATALLGALTGAWLRNRERNTVTTLGLAVAGGALLALGGLWSTVFPLNKNLWTSSFVLWTGGWSLLALAVFHQLVDVFGWRRLVFPLTVIGMNAITIYLAEHWMPLGKWFAVWFPATWDGVPIVQLAGAGLIVYWLLLYGLWRKRWFLRV